MDQLRITSYNVCYTKLLRGVLGDYALSLGKGYLIHGTLYHRITSYNVCYTKLLRIENTLMGSRIQNSVVGIGLNVNQADYGGLPNPVSLHQLKGIETDISYNFV